MLSSFTLKPFCQSILLHPGLYLFHGTEDVCVILLESADPREASERSGELIPMKHTKISQSQGQLSPGPRPVIEHQAEGESEAEPKCTGRRTQPSQSACLAPERPSMNHGGQ